MGRRGGGGGDRSGSPERGPGTAKGLFSNIWLWRGVAGVLAAAVILILCIQFGWLYFQRKCYYLSDSEASWNSSQSFCSLHNASLLVIENHQELPLELDGLKAHAKTVTSHSLLKAACLPASPCKQQTSVLALDVLKNAGGLSDFHLVLLTAGFMVKITKEDPWVGLYKRNEEFFWVNGKALDNKLIEVKGSGNCAYLESKGVSASGCYLTRKWVCSLSISLAR